LVTIFTGNCGWSLGVPGGYAGSVVLEFSGMDSGKEVVVAVF
jgi:hypothetical protein